MVPVPRKDACVASTRREDGISEGISCGFGADNSDKRQRQIPLLGLGCATRSALFCRPIEEEFAARQPRPAPGAAEGRNVWTRVLEEDRTAFAELPGDRRQAARGSLIRRRTEEVEAG